MAIDLMLMHLTPGRESQARTRAVDGGAVVAPATVVAGVERVVAVVERVVAVPNGGNVTAELMGGSPDEHPERYRAASPIERLPMAGAANLRLFHGAKDSVAPVEISRRFAEAAHCRLTEFAEAGHFDLIDPAEPCYREIRKATLALLFV